MTIEEKLVELRTERLGTFPKDIPWELKNLPRGATFHESNHLPPKELRMAQQKETLLRVRLRALEAPTPRPKTELELMRDELARMKAGHALLVATLDPKSKPDRPQRGEHPVKMLDGTPFVNNTKATLERQRKAAVEALRKSLLKD